MDKSIPLFVYAITLDFIEFMRVGTLNKVQTCEAHLFEIACITCIWLLYLWYYDTVGIYFSSLCGRTFSSWLLFKVSMCFLREYNSLYEILVVVCLWHCYLWVFVPVGPHPIAYLTLSICGIIYLKKYTPEEHSKVNQGSIEEEEKSPGRGRLMSPERGRLMSPERGQVTSKSTRSSQRSLLDRGKGDISDD